MSSAPKMHFVLRELCTLLFTTCIRCLRVRDFKLEMAQRRCCRGCCFIDTAGGPKTSSFRSHWLVSVLLWYYLPIKCAMHSLENISWMIDYLYLFLENSLILCAIECRDDLAVDRGGFLHCWSFVWSLWQKPFPASGNSPAIHLKCDFAQCSVNFCTCNWKKNNQRWKIDKPRPVLGVRKGRKTSVNLDFLDWTMNWNAPNKSVTVTD